MSKIHQLVHTLSYGDAISGEVLGLQRCFHALGHESEIYAINVHPKLKGKAKDYRELSSDFDGQIILHYSLGSPLNALYQELVNARRSLIYHNLTPPEWFSGVNPRIVVDIQQGQKELPELCKITDLLLADSKFNAQELKDLGFNAEVLELPVDNSRWDIATNQGILSVARSTSSLNVLHVGRLAPNKCVEDIIKAFYFLHHHVYKDSTLWLVGIDIDTELYSYALKRLANELRVDHAVRFCGCLADSEVKALYEASSVYLCMSEHEGFCLPVIEAMHFGLPVISYASSALPDTMGDGGILVTQKKHPEIAELIYELHTNQALRSKIIDAGKKRIAELSFDRFQSRVQELFSKDAASKHSTLLSAQA